MISGNLLLDSELRVVWSSPDWSEALGIEKGLAAPGSDARDLLGALPDELARRLARAWDGQEDIEGWIVRLPIAGEEHRVEISSSHLPDGGRLERVVSRPGPDSPSRLLREVLDQLPIDVTVTDREGRFLYANPHAVPNADLRDWLVGRTEIDYGHREDVGDRLARQRAIRREEALASRAPVTFEEEYSDRDGQRFHVLRSFVPMESGDGRPDRVLGFGLDLSDRIRADTERRERDAIYRAMFERNRAVKLLIDAETGRIIDANPAACEFYGWSRADLLEKRIQEINELSEAEIAVEMERANAGRKTAFEFRHRLASGEIRDVEVHSGPIRIEGRKLLFSIVHDVTERRRALDALAASEERYRRLFEQSKDAVYVSSPEGRLLEINEAGLRLLGYDSRHEALDLDLVRDVYVEPRDRERLLGTVEQRGFSKDFETRLRSRDGRSLVVLATTSAIRDEHDRIVAYLGILRDVTRQRQLEEQVRQSQKMEAVGRLAGGLAHDFNNLLTAINGFADLLLRTLDDERHLGFAEKIRASGRRAAELTGELLTLSRRRVVFPEVVDVNGAITRTAGTLEPMLGEDLRITLDLADGLEPVRIDTGQLEQALLNLAVNARDAMPEGGELRLATRKRESGPAGLEGGPWVEIEVSDSGPGIPTEHRDRVFDPFFTTKGVGEGSGLGLSTVYAIVTQSRGRILLDEAEPPGATFRLLLPPHRDVLREPVPPPVEREKRRGDRVLVVEDETAVRELVQRVLAEDGLRSVLAADAEAALEIAEREERFDLLITDVVMPGQSGPQLARTLCERDPSLRVLYISGYAAEIDRVGEPDHAMLAKPFEPAELLARVRELLERHDGRAEVEPTTTSDRPVA